MNMHISALGNFVIHFVIGEGEQMAHLISKHNFLSLQYTGGLQKAKWNKTK